MTYIIIGVVAAIAVMVLAFVVKNIVDRKKYQPEVCFKVSILSA